ncbi:hypothetical protein A9Q76_01335 [Arcobacter sp. 31_11_sub10_T18]|nr:hypothetical protein A9Q76_01335 [Arcobacter sp. 31_11_sub10_T18]
MPAAIRDIVKSVLEYLKENSLTPTPENYKRVFYEQAQIHGFDISDCDRLSTFANKLNQEEILELNDKNIVDIDSLFDYVVEKLREKENSILSSSSTGLSKSTVEKIASLMISALAPVYVNDKLDKDINKLNKMLKSDLSIFNKDEVQDNIEDYILKRKYSDKNVISDKTEKLNSIVCSMGDYIQNSVSKSDDSLNELDNILVDLEQLTLKEGDISSLELIRADMVSINKNMKDIVTNLSENLNNEKNEVSSLREKVLELEENLKNAKVESSTDFLTGSFTRREFNKRVKKLNTSYNKSKNDFSIIYIDLDYFKRVNDKFGHDAGDEVLKTFSRVLKQKIADNGDVFRYGGEEFVVLLPLKNKKESKVIIEDVKEHINKSKFIYKDFTIKVTFSAGVALRSEHRRVDDFIKEADRLLYKAKEDGRDLIH